MLMYNLFNSSGDELENKFDNYGNMIYKICLVILCNHYDAEDALQKTFLRYVEKKPIFNDCEHEKAWFIVVATNICKDMLRFKNRHILLNLSDYEQYSINEEEFNILEQILSLPLKYKTIIHLYYVEGYKINDISRILKISQSAVKTRLYRGRKILKLELGGEEYERK